MQQINKDGLWPGATYLASPNFSVRPVDEEVDLIVVHGISLPPGQFGGPAVEQLFTNQLDCSVSEELSGLETLRVSAHLLIDRWGIVTQFVPFHRRAWHAGESAWAGRQRCNDYSIGIELEGADGVAYTPRQYDQLVAVVGALMRRYPAIDTDRVVGHADIAPGRKTDPGPAFNWSALHRRIERARDRGPGS